MSGGHWNYKDMDFDSVNPEQLKEILESLPEAFHIIDWCETNDSIYDNKLADNLYEIIHRLGHKLFDES